MDPRVEKLKTPKECETFMVNARAAGREDLAQEARRRAIEPRAKTYGANSSVEQECLEAVYAYEEVLSEKHGRRMTAAGTWPMIKRLGVLKAVEKIVSRPDDAAGYTALIGMGLEKFAFEAVVVRYPDEFSFEAVEQSKSRVARRKTGAS